MSRRKGSNSRKKDPSFDRSDSGNLGRDSRSNGKETERQLFNPRSDDPITFNKQHLQRLQQQQQQQRRVNSPDNSRKETKISARLERASQRAIDGKRLFNPHTDDPVNFKNIITDRQSDDYGSRNRRVPASGRRLWSAKDGIPTATVAEDSSSLKTGCDVAVVGSRPGETSFIKTIEAQEPKKSATKIHQSLSPPVTTEEDQEKEQRRKQCKAIIHKLRALEDELEKLNMKARSMVLFKEELAGTEDDDEHFSNSRRRLTAEDKPIGKNEVNQLTEQDVADAEHVWRGRVELHEKLGAMYLELLRCDLEYAEKKGLETLAWKRVVYNLISQFRKTLDRLSFELNTKPSLSTGDEINESMPASGASINQPKQMSKLEAMLFSDDENAGLDTSVTEMPIINESGGMTFVKIEQPNPIETAAANKKLQRQYFEIVMRLFMQYLDQADVLYSRIASFLWIASGDSNDSEIENSLQNWQRTRRYKWYNSVSLRSDIARYRWTYLPEDINMPSNNSDNEQKSTYWTKEDAFLEAWRRYSLCIWFMPARGNLYYNLSLLLSNRQSATPNHDLYKLYFSIRSLMVKRNGFLNAREGIIVLFERNRRWIRAHIPTVGNNSPRSKNKRSKPKSKSISSTADRDISIPACFVRLHGMLFTKIELDEFAQTKRLFFNALFDTNAKHLRCLPDCQMQQKILSSAAKPTLSPAADFWLQIIILCLSSLYTYEFANSKLSKLISLNFANRFTAPKEHHQHQEYQTLLDELKDNVLFTYQIDLACQIAVELFQRYLDSSLSPPVIPQLSHLPQFSCSYLHSRPFLFETARLNDCALHAAHNDNAEAEIETDQAYLVYIEILLHWIVMNGVCIRTEGEASLWELLVGAIDIDLFTAQHKGRTLTLQRDSKISIAFWPLLLDLLNKLLLEIPEDDKYDIINKHILDEGEVGNETDNAEDNTASQTSNYSGAEYAFVKSIISVLSETPDLPEEEQLRGLGWVDDINGRFLKVAPKLKRQQKLTYDSDISTRRKIRIMQYGFVLVKQLEGICYYDPVEEKFTMLKTVEDRIMAMEEEAVIQQQQRQRQLEEEQQLSENVENSSNNEADATIEGTTISEMDDDVLFSSETSLNFGNIKDNTTDEDDSILTQLKKRREQLQAMVATAEAEARAGYRRLPARVKEREARLSYLRERIIPGKTVLVLDTNCFIGHLEHVTKLFQLQRWSIVVPLVVITELDGLKSNASKLGSVAQSAIGLIEDTLAAKQKQSTSLRIQTSHNNFLSAISIRSEQFVFGETDRNLDDLILSACLWWISQQQQQKGENTVVPVCLVTGDRNLSVKARARDVEVVPVSAIMQLTPKET